MESSSIDINKLVDESFMTFKDIFAKLAQLKGWNMASLKSAFDMMPEIVKHTELVGKLRGLNGEEKKSFAIKLILRLRPAPFWLPTPFYRMVLGWVIDSIVAALKDKFN